MVSSLAMFRKTQLALASGPLSICLPDEMVDVDKVTVHGVLLAGVKWAPEGKSVIY
jgi:hypothetical protein